MKAISSRDERLPIVARRTIRHQRKPTRSELAAIAAILILAALLRLGWPGITEFKFDEARIVALSLDLVEGKSFPLQGIRTSLGLPKPPPSLYLYAIPLLLWRNPLSATLFTGLLSVCAVALCWWLARRYWGPGMALISTLIFATSPWAVIFSRKIWEPNLLPPFATAYALTALLAFVEGKGWALAAHIALLGVTIQIHYPSLPLVLLTLLLLVFYRKRVNWRMLLVGLGLAFLSSTPFVYYLFTHQHEILQGVRGVASRPASVDWQAFRYWWLITTGSEIHSLAGPSAYLDFLKSIPNLDPTRWVVGVLAVGGIGLWLWGALRRHREESARAGAIVALWAIMPILVNWRHAMPLYLHYFTVSLPAPYLAAGFALSRVLLYGRQVVRWALSVVVIGIAASQAGIVLALLSYVGTHATPGGFGMPLKFQLEASEQAKALAAPIVVVSSGGDPFFSEWPSVFDVLLRGKPHRFVDGRHAALFPSIPSTLLLTPDVERARKVYSAAGIVDPSGEIPARPGEEGLIVARPGVGTPLDLMPVAEPCLLANGVEIIGYRLNGKIVPGQAIEWWIAWRVIKPPPDPTTEYHIFNHLLDGQGTRLSQADSPTVPAKDWSVGDVVVQVFQLEVAPQTAMGSYRMRVGMYTYPGLKNQPLLDVAGNPTADAVIIGPLASP